MARSQKELNEDFVKLKSVVKELHLDVADGKFVQNTTLWFPFKLSKKFTYNAHLMIKDPEKWIKAHFSQIWLFIPHFEEIKDKEGYISWMKKERRQVAFALKPETKVKGLVPFLNRIDYILVLTVHPGFYGAKYLPKELKKIQEIKKVNPKIKVIVDGGMCPETINQAKQAGADYFVSGSYTTKSDNPKKAIKTLLGAMRT